MFSCVYDITYGVTYAKFKTFQHYNLCNLIKTPQKPVPGSFSIKVTKICHENMGIGLKFPLDLFINFISTRSAPQIMSIKDECTFLFSNFLIIGLCNSSANSLPVVFSF